jgi:hypothetical protein
LLEALEGLPEDAAYNLLFHATGPSILHDICGASCVHEAECDVQLVAVQPGSSDPKDVWVLRKGHELSFPLEKAQRALGKFVEVENLESTWDVCVRGSPRMIRRIVHDRG